MIAYNQDELPRPLVLEWQQLEAMRIEGCPIAYLVRKKAFHAIELFVNGSVLIPRPETELLVETAIETIHEKLLLASYSKISPLRILDLGTGSGAIILAIANHFHTHPNADRLQLIASDVSNEALQIAIKNANHLSLNSVQFIESHWFDHLPNTLFDLILSNPPYIAKGDIHLTQGDLRFEPQIALTDGEDGLDAYRQIAGSFKTFLKPNGQIIVEHGYDQCLAIHAIFTESGLQDVACLKDFSGLDRITKACSK
jgi:release factor glutamine methyltransferase